MYQLINEFFLHSLKFHNFQEDLQDLVAKGIYKPNIVFFGEGLPDAFHDAIENDCVECDLLVVIGSSLKVSIIFINIKEFLK